jgi:pimeloyl-ACP methyl ester carboxylesterase
MPGPEPIAFTSAGVRLAGERWDARERRGVVVLLHGGGQTRHSWAGTAQRLAAHGWTTVALDARGHGDSEWHPAQDYTLDGFVADLRAFVAGLDEPPVLVGASLGGITALLAVGEHPGLARALVLVDVVVRVRPEGVARIRDFMTAHPHGFASLEEVADAISQYNPRRRRPRNLDGLRKNVRRGNDGRWYWHWDPAFISGRMGGQDETRSTLVDPDRLGVAARGLHVPALLVRGRMSDLLSEEGAREFLELVPHARMVDVSGAGHMVAGDRNDAFNDAVVSFLDTVRHS